MANLLKAFYRFASINFDFVFRKPKSGHASVASQGDEFDKRYREAHANPEQNDYINTSIRQRDSTSTRCSAPMITTAVVEFDEAEAQWVVDLEHLRVTA
ncbi:hypothetical protein FQN53_009352 [Emmonsiellopsis sp. PD_33]|nr:hypothetical protein FQN53_009352 [Emmonsiellopsis sp. PD_33]